MSPTAEKLIGIGQANAMLPLVSRIVADIAESTRLVGWRQEHLIDDSRSDEDVGVGEDLHADDPYSDERRAVELDLERERARLTALRDELHQLGVELDDPLGGVVHFPAEVEGLAVHLCWKLSEPEVGFWHYRDEGFESRRKLSVSPASN
jgi:hypothetical protein